MVKTQKAGAGAAGKAETVAKPAITKAPSAIRHKKKLLPNRKLPRHVELMTDDFAVIARDEGGFRAGTLNQAFLGAGIAKNGKHLTQTVMSLITQKIYILALGAAIYTEMDNRKRISEEDMKAAIKETACSRPLGGLELI